jgi:glutathione synthase/RimK-type ligase-like ATP-grasp enzyme
VPRYESPHPLIRSWDNGWKISYTGVTQDVRDIAHSAVAALELDFGAVDIGRTRSGDVIVLEVNRAPGVEGSTLDAYVKAIQRWVQAA